MRPEFGNETGRKAKPPRCTNRRRFFHAHIPLALPPRAPFHWELAQSKLLIINGLGLELMRRIKAAFKPHGILNSGKVL
jgi:FAD-dependent oxidoreductase family protein